MNIHESAVIGQGTVIGDDGFGFTRDEQGVLHFRPHKFSVTIGEDVWIGNNCTIDRGRWRDTVVNGGSKIDNGAHIAHNAIIGSHCLIHAFANICGSVNVGDYTEIFPHVNVAPGVTIGDNCTIGSHTFIRNDVPDDTTVYGNGKAQVSIKHDIVNIYKNKV